jgi:hypothetical protein
MPNVSWLFDTPGVGGAVAVIAIVSLVTTYYVTLRWISRGQDEGNDNH